MSKPFASSADTARKEETLEVVGEGVYALTAEGDPNVGAVEGADFVVAFEARATPHTDKPVRYLVLSHYHAVRTLGASAFGADVIVAHENTRALIAERGEQDWASEAGRMPRLFEGAESIPGLTWPTVTFSDRLRIDLGGSRGELELAWCGRGHTEGDIVAWLPAQRVLFAGDLVEARAALYTGDAYHLDWMSTTLDGVANYDADVLVGGRGAVVRGPEVAAAIDQTRGFLRTMHDEVERVRAGGGSLREAFEAAHAALEPAYGGWPIFEHCLPFDVQRMWDELESPGSRPRIWTAERDREVWDLLQS
jgi:glyoxylase-like metal-dependent hydrolase (beta-lactamase superfamily II)